MPGTPATSPYFGAPRYANTDPADFSTDVNAITDTFDAKLGVRRQDVVVVSANYTAVAGDLVASTGVHTITLPAGTDNASVVVAALTGDQTVNRAGTDTITQFATTGLTTLVVHAKTVQEFRWKTGIWYAVAATQWAGGDLTGTIDNLQIAPNAVTSVEIASGAVAASELDPAVANATSLPGDLVVSAAATRAGCVLCDGTAYSRTNPTYSALFAAIGVAFGAGDGTTTFNVPDYRGRSIIGAGTGAGLTARTLGSKGGTETYALATGDLPAHQHPITDIVHGHGVTEPAHAHDLQGNNVPAHSSGWGSATNVQQSGGATNNLPFNNNSPVQNIIGTGAATTGLSVNGGGTGLSHTDNAGGGAGHTNMQPWATANVFIKL